MKLLLSSGMCGMSPHQGSVVGGLYFMLVGTMQLVFEVGHLRTARESLNTTGSPLLPQLCFNYYYTLLGMESTTILLALCMLAAVWAQRPLGILGFAVWLILYDVALLVVTSLLQVQMQAAGLKLSPLTWYGIVCRLVGDPFWLAFVITHGVERLQPVDRKRKGGKAQEGAPLKLKFKAFDGGV